MCRNLERTSSDPCNPSSGHKVPACGSGAAISPASSPFQPSGRTTYKSQRKFCRLIPRSPKVAREIILLIPRLDGRPGRHDEVSEGLHDLLRRRPGLAIADRPAVDFDDRCDFCRGTRDESLVRSPDIVEGEE